MKLEIELDLDKIDYDAINKQIIEKVAAVDIKDVYDIESKINSKIHNLVYAAVEDAYSEYLSRYWGGNRATKEGKQFINDVITNEIKSRTEKVVEDVFANEYSEEVIREVTLKMIPNVFAYVLFERFKDSLHMSDINYQEMVHHMIKDEIESKINDMRY